MNNVVLVLDAMGVIYQAADDVAELLVPFVDENGGLSDADAVGRLYTLASLGEITANEFWKSAGVSTTLEDSYLARHKLSDGLEEFLDSLPSSIKSLWCLSNDLSEWSQKLRDHHGLNHHFAGFVISGDVRSRKPDIAIYQKLLERAECRAEECVFVDDRAKNPDAARLLGFNTIGFGALPTIAPDHLWAKSFGELAEHLQ